MSGPNASPESLELQLLREIREEVCGRLDAIERRLDAMDAGLTMLDHEQQRLATAVEGRAPRAPRPTPRPRAVGDSWAPPDHGDHGR